MRSGGMEGHAAKARQASSHEAPDGQMKYQAAGIKPGPLQNPALQSGARCT
jgi:hypothetical protein